MTGRKFELRDSKKGSALGVRITPRASENKIIGALSDGTIKIHIKASNTEGQMNSELIKFLSGIFGVAEDRIEVVAGNTSKDKLISVLDLDSETLHKKIVENIE